MAKEITKEQRERIIKAYLDQANPKDIAKIIGCSLTTVLRIVKRYNNNGTIASKTRGGNRLAKVNEEHKTAMRRYISEDAGISLKQIGVKLENEFNINVSKSTIDRCIDSFSFTLKRTSLIPERRNEADLIEERYQYATEFYEWYNMEEGNDLFFLDEVGFNVAMRSKRGRSLLGTSAIIRVSKLRTRNISVCCVMSRQGTLHYKKQTHAFNTVTFATFIDEVLEIFDTKGYKNKTIIMDNVRFHHSSVILQKIVEKGHKIKFIPPYSPFLNPIENMFSQWKQLVKRSNPINESNLLILIDEKFNEISNLQCNNYFRHMLKNIHKCILKEQITDN